MWSIPHSLDNIQFNQILFTQLCAWNSLEYWEKEKKRNKNEAYIKVFICTFITRVCFFVRLLLKEEFYSQDIKHILNVKIGKFWVNYGFSSILFHWRRIETSEIPWYSQGNKQTIEKNRLKSWIKVVWCFKLEDIYM